MGLRDTTEENPFQDLPEALVEDMLAETEKVSEEVFSSFENIISKRDSFRNSLKALNVLKKDSDLPYPNMYPTSCGVDGSYAIERSVSLDFIVSAAVAVEGLPPPKEEKNWPAPHTLSKILGVAHSEANSVVARSLMMAYELELAINAPHNIKMLDGSLTTPLIYFNQAINKIQEVDDKLRDVFLDKICDALSYYLKILDSKRNDRIFVSIPKYTTRKEIVNLLGEGKNFEDRGLLSFILREGEFVGPIDIEQPSSKWHLKCPPDCDEAICRKIESSLDNIKIVYYRPHIHIPVLRLEISSFIASNKNILSVLLSGIKYQTSPPGIMEPYPLYLADKMVKHIRTALPAIRRAVSSKFLENWNYNFEDVYLALHSYRTESRGGI